MKKVDFGNVSPKIHFFPRSRQRNILQAGDVLAGSHSAGVLKKVNSVLEIRLFGNLEVCLKEEPFKLAPRPAQARLISLILHPD